ncbi:4-carboxymuconolactone decarboxylase [Alkalilimnicola ehrlichii]|uniref:4-carboxymuconolactone decarboxylase n=1 Tax=Alkalilimnicola ehrlichii TaxID=351052 RepID=A0A3E0WMS7_9GAMM|nr:carboxymuconolactone decarboxylase family protein [Alkalilimnicola ehrlichii]RFA26388.1 4-carboxymuconolactone decarboxylase [Alkalilimnicola ehrlichii]RFA33451.1 4-carboxymuconolactone decarboxylase [Alkalilimnicola ehrlichii]
MLSFSTRRKSVLTGGALIASALLPFTVQATTTEARSARGAEMIRHLNNGEAQPNLEAMREEFPFLAEATEAYALGDVWGRDVLDNRTRQLAAVAAMAALGETGLMRVHAGYALNVGVTEEELKEIVYMITVPAGFPRAIAASQALSELFSERRSSVVE